MKRLEKYITEKGRCPFDEWFNHLKDKKTQAVIDYGLVSLRQGHSGKVQSLGHGLKELKIYVGPGIRVYFLEEDETLIVLLLGGNKSSQARDIKKARAFLKDYWSE
jgi:putative addiction module killer protein